MSTQLAKIDVVQSPSLMNSEELGLYVQDRMTGLLKTLADLKPYIEELWVRFDNGETIMGCKTRKEFCEQVLQRTPRAVRYMLNGRTPKGEQCSSRDPEFEFPYNVKAGDVLFCIDGKTRPCLHTVVKVTDKRINIGGDGQAGFPFDTLMCWTVRAIRIATPEDCELVEDYEDLQQIKERIKQERENADPRDENGKRILDCETGKRCFYNDADIDIHVRTIAKDGFEYCRYRCEKCQQFHVDEIPPVTDAEPTPAERSRLSKSPQP
jgi:hypothetical protein